MGGDSKDVRGDLTRLLDDVGKGERRAEDLLPIVYEELRALARARMAKERPGQTLQATALVHEAWMRLVTPEAPDWNGRGHFFGAAALAMRRILVEQARRRARVKRGGGHERVDLADVEPVLEGPAAQPEEVLAIEEAVARLEAADPRKGRIVNLRYFAGLTNEETAEALGVSVGTIEREWRFIRSWLRSELGEGFS
ncbi:MAG: sigma-70 family RNA polymerase sigma factor [Planctomycetota bacterium]